MSLDWIADLAGVAGGSADELERTQLDEMIATALARTAAWERQMLAAVGCDPGRVVE